MMPEITDHAKDHPAISILLLCLGWVLNVLAGLTADDIYTWVFRVASLVSVLMIIILNWRKVVEEIKSIFRKK